jgi:hypothetical protein
LGQKGEEANLGKQVQAVRTQIRAEFRHGLRAPLGEGGLEVPVGTDTRPQLLGGRAESTENAEEFVDLGIAGEEGREGNLVAVMVLVTVIVMVVVATESPGKRKARETH